jgi:hypothetical protein
MYKVQHLKTHQKIEVFWKDHCYIKGWCQADPLQDVLGDCKLVGYFIESFPDRIVVADCLDINSKKYGNLWVIGRAMITKIRKIK